MGSELSCPKHIFDGIVPQIPKAGKRHGLLTFGLAFVSRVVHINQHSLPAPVSNAVSIVRSHLVPDCSFLTSCLVFKHVEEEHIKLIFILRSFVMGGLSWKRSRVFYQRFL